MDHYSGLNPKAGGGWGGGGGGEYISNFTLRTGSIFSRKGKMRSTEIHTGGDRRCPIQFCNSPRGGGLLIFAGT